MKKIIAFVLSFILVLSLASCAAKKPTADFKIFDLEGNVLYSFSEEITDGCSAGTLLEKYFKENSIPYTIYDNDMLESVNDLVMDTENWSIYWAVYVNGEYGTVSLWQQELKDGDLIEIKFEEFAM